MRGVVTDGVGGAPGPEFFQNNVLVFAVIFSPFLPQNLDVGRVILFILAYFHCTISPEKADGMFFATAAKPGAASIACCVSCAWVRASRSAATASAVRTNRTGTASMSASSGMAASRSTQSRASGFWLSTAIFRLVSDQRRKPLASSALRARDSGLLYSTLYKPPASRSAGGMGGNKTCADSTSSSRSIID